jgi:hypothetical protein
LFLIQLEVQIGRRAGRRWRWSQVPIFQPFCVTWWFLLSLILAQIDYQSVLTVFMYLRCCGEWKSERQRGGAQEGAVSIMWKLLLHNLSWQLALVVSDAHLQMLTSILSSILWPYFALSLCLV